MDSYASSALKESYIERIDRLKSEYERAGASGSFNAGVETGKLLTDLAALVTGVGAAVKGTTSIAGKVITKTVGKAALKDAQNVAKEAAKDAGKGVRDAGFPQMESQLKHIFRDAKGHLPDTPENRKKILDVVSSKSNYRGIDGAGNKVFSKLNNDGTQTWAYVRNGIIQNAGENTIPKTYVPGKGLR